MCVSVCARDCRRLESWSRGAAWAVWPLRRGRAGLGCHSSTRSGLVCLVSVGRYSGLSGGMGKLLSLGCLGSSGLLDCVVAVALLTDAGGTSRAIRGGPGVGGPCFAPSSR